MKSAAEGFSRSCLVGSSGEREGSSYDRKLIDVASSLAGGERLPTRAFIYVGREDRFGEAFGRDPLYANVNARGELDWKAG